MVLCSYCILLILFETIFYYIYSAPNNYMLIFILKIVGIKSHLKMKKFQYGTPSLIIYNIASSHQIAPNISDILNFYDDTRNVLIMFSIFQFFYETPSPTGNIRTKSQDHLCWRKVIKFSRLDADHILGSNCARNSRRLSQQGH